MKDHTPKYFYIEIQKCHSPKLAYSSETKWIELWDSERQQNLRKIRKVVRVIHSNSFHTDILFDFVWLLRYHLHKQKLILGIQNGRDENIFHMPNILLKNTNAVPRKNAVTLQKNPKY